MKEENSRLKHWLTGSIQTGYIALAFTALLIGLIGIITPLLPTTPFLLVAAWAAAKGSSRISHGLMQWIMLHPQLFAPINAWQTEGAIPYSAKRLALLMMFSSWVGLLLTGISWPTLVGVTGLLVVIGLFIVSRPAPEAESNRPLETIALYRGCKIYKDLRAYSDPEVFHE